MANPTIEYIIYKPECAPLLETERNSWKHRCVWRCLWKPIVDLSVFVVQFPLVVDLEGQILLQKELTKIWRVYNELVTKSLSAYNEMAKSSLYRGYIYLLKKAKRLKKKCLSTDTEKIKTLNDTIKLYNQKLNRIKECYGLTEYGLQHMILPYSKYYGLATHIAQKVASQVWASWNAFFSGKGKCVHHKRKDSFNTIPGKATIGSVSFKCINPDKYKYLAAITTPGRKVKKLQFKVVIRKDPSGYLEQALKRPVHNSRITRKWVHNQWKYYIQVTFSGKPPIKVNPQTGEIRHQVQMFERNGIDIGPQTVASASHYGVALRDLGGKLRNQLQSMENEKSKLLRQMDHSRRALNPLMYNPNGTCKRGAVFDSNRKRVRWQYSKNYFKKLARYRDLCCKQKDIRKEWHNILANEILSMGNDIVVEKMQFKALQARAKETKKNKNGKNLSKKRFGKSIANCAPSAFLEILKNKALQSDGFFNKVSTFKTKASQYDHTDNKFKKKGLSNRAPTLTSGDLVQRDLYSAYLLAHVDGSFENYDRDTLIYDFPAFMSTQNKEICSLINQKAKLPSSAGLKYFAKAA